MNNYIPKSELKQFKTPYNSTIAFYKLLKKFNLLNKNVKSIIDIGTGIGSNLQYFSRKKKKIHFLGTDYQPHLIKLAKKLNKNKKIQFRIFDIAKKSNKYKNQFNGLTCIHTLCCFKKIEKVITNMCNINPEWIAINSLFYDGNLDVLIHIRDYDNKKFKDKNPNADFNIFSLMKTEEIFRKNGYKLIVKKQYFPNKPIKKNEKKRGSYTIKTELNNYTTFSGPVYLPWYFIIAKKNEKKK